MTISVIIPTYNRAYSLKRAIDSVLAQTYRDFELLVVDDGSTDDSAELLAKINPQIPFKVLTHQKNQGVSAARNYGIENSLAPWIAFLDSDDEWLPEKLQKQMQFAEQYPELRLVHADEIWIRNGVRVNQMNKHKKLGGRIFKRCVDLCCISPSAVLLRRDLFSDVGLFNEEFPVCEDYELWLRVCAGEDVGFIDTPLIKKYGGHEDQLSRSMVAMDLWRVRALLPFVKPDYFGFTSENSLRDLLKGSTNEFFHLISEEERLYAKESILTRLEIMKKGAIKHNNQELIKEINLLSQWV